MPSNDYDRYAPIPAWGGNVNYDFVLPSKQVVLLRKLQMEDIVELDLIDAMDTFTGLMTVPENAKAKKSKKAANEEEQIGRQIFGNPEKFKAVMKTADKCILKAVLKPTVQEPPAEFAERVEGVVYLDTIPFADKLAIFNEVFEGVGGFESFREEPTENVGSVEDEQDV